MPDLRRPRPPSFLPGGVPGARPPSLPLRADHGEDAAAARVGASGSAVLRSLACLLTCCVLVACGRAPEPAAPHALAAPLRPAQAVQLLTRHLRDNDLAAFARDAVPPALHARLEDAWS